MGSVNVNLSFWTQIFRRGDIIRVFRELQAETFFTNKHLFARTTICVDPETRERYILR